MRGYFVACVCVSRGCGFARCLCPSVRLSAVLAVWCGCPFGCRLSVCGCVWWFFWCGGVGMRARVFLYGLRNNRKRATANGLRVSVCLRLCLPSVSVSAVFVRPSNLIFLSLIISPYSRGVFYTKTATEKRRTVCVRSPSLPQTFLRTPTPLASVDRFGNFPNSGGEFRNGNLGIFSCSVQSICKFSRTVGIFSEDLSNLQNRAHFTWLRTSPLFVPATL